MAKAEVFKLRIETELNKALADINSFNEALERSVKTVSGPSPKTPLIDAVIRNLDIASERARILENNLKRLGQGGIVAMPLVDKAIAKTGTLTPNLNLTPSGLPMYQFNARAAMLTQNAIAQANANQQLNTTLAQSAALANKNSLSFISMFGAMVTGQLAVDALYGAFRKLKGVIVESIEIADKMRLQAASMAGAMVISDPSMGFAQAKANADKMIEATFAMSRGFVGNARELQILTEAAVTFGLKLDFTSQKGRESFIAFANTLKLITQGQNFEIQAFQEIRAIMQGQNFQGAMLARRLQAVGIDVQKMVPMWVAQGTVIENIVQALGGYAQASEAIKNTWQAQRKTIESIYQLILAKGAEKAYDELKNRLTEINDLFLDQNGLTERSKRIIDTIADAWRTVFNVAEGLYIVYSDLKSVISAIFNELTRTDVLSGLFDTLFGKVGELFDLIGGKTVLDALGLGPTQMELAKGSMASFFDEVKKYIKEVMVMGLPAIILAYAGQPKLAAGWLIGSGLYYTAKNLGEEKREKEGAYIKGLDEESKRFVGPPTPGAFAGPELPESGAWSPTGITIADKEMQGYMRGVKNFINKSTLEIEALLVGQGDSLAGAIAKAKARVYQEYSKFFVFEDGKIIEETPEFSRLSKGEMAQGIVDQYTAGMKAALTPESKKTIMDQYKRYFNFSEAGDIIGYTETFQKMKDSSDKQKSLAAQIKGNFWRELAAVETNEMEKYNDKVAAQVGKVAENEKKYWEHASKLYDSVRRQFTTVTSEFENETEPLTAKITKIYEDLGKELKEAEKTFGVQLEGVDWFELSKAGEMLKQVATWLQSIADLKAKIATRDDAKKKEKEALDLQAGTYRIREEIEALRQELATPLKWPWNEEEVAQMEDFNRANNLYSAGIVKAYREMATLEKGRVGKGWTVEALEQYDVLTSKITTLQDVWRDVLMKIQDANDSTTKSIALMWRDVYEGIKGFINSFWDDVLDGQLKGLEEYWLAFNKMISKAFLSMATEQFMSSFMGKDSSMGKTIKTAGESFSSIWGGKTTEQKRKEGTLAAPEIPALTELKQMAVQEMTVNAGVVNIVGELTGEGSAVLGLGGDNATPPRDRYDFRGNLLEDLQLPEGYTEKFGLEGPNETPPQDVYDAQGNMIENLDEVSSSLELTSDAVKESGNVLSTSFMKTADGMVRGGMQFVNGLMSMMGGGGGEWNWWKEIGGGIMKGIGMLGGMGGGGGGFDSSVAMDPAHAGMYGLKEGGIFQGGFIPIRAFAGGGVVKRPTIGLVGEGGDDEAIVPLRGGAIPVKMQGKPKEGGVAIHFNIQSADVKDFDRLLYERKNMIAGIIRQELRNASGTRDEIRRYAF